MRIYIATISREAVLVELPETAKVSDLKKEISTKIPDTKLSEQILKFESKVLVDSNTMKQSGITENSIIELLVLRKNSIFIKMTDGKLHEFDVDFTKTIDVVKKQITQSLNIPSECQRLYMTELKSKDVLSSKMIGPGTTLALCVIELNLKLNLVHTKSSFPPELIEVPKNHKISQLKDMIVTKWKIPLAHQMLIYSTNGQILDNKKTLADYNILNMSTINVKQINVEIFIDVAALGRSRIMVHALLQDTIEVLKKKIQNTLKIGVESQKLIWNGTVLNDRDILADKGIVSGSTLNFIPVIQLFQIKISGNDLLESVCVDTNINETVAELKQKVESATNIPLAQQILKMGAAELQNDKKLFEYTVKAGSTLLLSRRETFQLCVEIAKGYTVKVRVHKDDRVRCIKNELHLETLGIVYDHALTFLGITLNDDFAISAYGIEPGNTIKLVKIR